MDITPSTKQGFSRVAARTIEAKQHKILQLEAEVAHYKQQLEDLLKGSVPQIVKNWMFEYDLPWECFWCFEHNEWIIELDSSFPYHWENNNKPKWIS